MYIQFNISKIMIFLITVTVFLILANLTVIIIKFDYNININTIFYKLIFDDEENIPTFFSSTILLFSSVLLFIVANFHKIGRTGDYKYWLVLALIFLFLAVDEGSSLHEYIILLFWRAYEPSDFDNYVWPSVYGILVALLAIAYWKFIFSLPKRIFLLFILSAILYVGGAIGFELLGSVYIGASWYQPIEWEAVADQTYYLIATVEESAEIFGVLVFIYALLKYIEIKWQGLYLYEGIIPSKREVL
ncbi:hypothetical protein [uncultured Sneathiella sp.]|uniref:hypothetical protein n=1 Tax=uncultured Sneathiella sp. TaxID=879315 RepID=UPI0030EED0AC